jgi:hypothetical protein
MIKSSDQSMQNIELNLIKFKSFLDDLFLHFLSEQSIALIIKKS